MVPSVITCQAKAKQRDFMQPNIRIAERPYREGLQIHTYLPHIGRNKILQPQLTGRGDPIGRVCAVVGFGNKTSGYRNRYGAWPDIERANGITVGTQKAVNAAYRNRRRVNAIMGTRVNVVLPRYNFKIGVAYQGFAI